MRTDTYTASRLMQYDAAGGTVVTHLKYDYLKALLSTFKTGPVLFKIYRRGRGRTYVESGELEMREGKVSFPVASRELVCLKSKVK